MSSAFSMARKINYLKNKKRSVFLKMMYNGRKEIG